MTTEILIPRTTTFFGKEYGGAAPIYGYILVIFLRSVITQSHFEIISIMSVFLNDSCHEGTFQDQEKAEKNRHQKTSRSAPGPAHQE